MFSYRFPKWEKEIDVKKFSIATTVIYILTLLPMLIIGHFNWLTADDTTLAYSSSQYFRETGNALGALAMAFVGALMITSTGWGITLQT